MKLIRYNCFIPCRLIINCLVYIFIFINLIEIAILKACPADMGNVIVCTRKCFFAPVPRYLLCKTCHQIEIHRWIFSRSFKFFCLFICCHLDSLLIRSYIVFEKCYVVLHSGCIVEADSPDVHLYFIIRHKG